MEIMMNMKETARIVARVCDIDRRDVTDQLIATWHEIIGVVPYDEAVEALHIVASESPDIIKPAHLLRARKTARAQIERRNRRASVQRAIAAATKPDRIAALTDEIQRSNVNR